MVDYPEELREQLPEGGQARLHTEAYEQRIQKRKGEVLKQITTTHAVLNRAKTCQFDFTIGEASGTFADVGSGKNDTFSKGVCDKMFGRTYTALNWEERNFVDNLVYILAKEYGLLMHVMREGDRFEFNFLPSVGTLGVFKFYNKAKNIWLYPEWKPLLISEQAKVVQHTREQLGTSRLSAEALYQTGIRRTVLDLATSSGSLAATLEAFIKNISLQDRKKILQGLDLFSEDTSPHIRADQDTIFGINKYLRYYFEFEQGYTGAPLEQKLKEHAVHPDGTAYRGTALQNLAWVNFIRYDLLHYPPPPGSKAAFERREELPLRFELEKGEAWIPESIPETTIMEANRRLQNVEDELRAQLGEDASFLNFLSCRIKRDTLSYKEGIWTHIDLEGKFSFSGLEKERMETVSFENKSGSIDSIPLSVAEIGAALKALVQEEIERLKKEKRAKEKQALHTQFQNELNFFKQNCALFQNRYEILKEKTRENQIQIQKLEGYANAVFGTERSDCYEEAKRSTKKAEDLKQESVKLLRAFYEGDFITSWQEPDPNTMQYQVGLLGRIEELQSVITKLDAQTATSEPQPDLLKNMRANLEQYRSMEDLKPLLHQLTPSFSTKEEFVNVLLNKHIQTLQAQLLHRNKEFSVQRLSSHPDALFPTYDLQVSLQVGEIRKEVQIRVTLPISYRVKKKEAFWKSFDFDVASNVNIKILSQPYLQRETRHSLREAVFTAAKELEAASPQ